MRHRLASLILFCAFSAHAMLLETPLADPAQEAAAQALFHELKCVVCEGQALADSNADFAADMRAQVRRMLESGQSPADIRQYFSSRYGDQVLMTPPMAARTYLLWFGPLLVLLAGGLILWRNVKEHRA